MVKTPLWTRKTHAVKLFSKMIKVTVYLQKWKLLKLRTLTIAALFGQIWFYSAPFLWHPHCKAGNIRFILPDIHRPIGKQTNLSVGEKFFLWSITLKTGNLLNVHAALLDFIRYYYVCRVIHKVFSHYCIRWYCRI